MKRFLFALCLSLAFAGNAYALKVTNLDHVPHTVYYESAGTVTGETIAPNQSVSFHGHPDGLLSLKDERKAVKGRSTVQSNGILSGYIGNGSSQDMPASSNYDFVIWPGGDLRIQHHRNGNIF